MEMENGFMVVRTQEQGESVALVLREALRIHLMMKLLDIFTDMVVKQVHIFTQTWSSTRYQETMYKF